MAQHCAMRETPSCVFQHLQMRGDEFAETQLEVIREERTRKGLVEMRADGGRDTLERARELDGRKAHRIRCLTEVAEPQLAILAVDRQCEIVLVRRHHDLHRHEIIGLRQMPLAVMVAVLRVVF